MFEHMQYLNQLQNNKLLTSFRISQNKMREIEKNNQKLLQRIISISNRKVVKPNFCSGHLMPLGSVTQERPFAKSLSVDFKRKEAQKIIVENSSLVNRIIKKTAFLTVNQINKDFHQHEKHLNMIRKMDSTNNKMKVKGLEKLSNKKLLQLPHINEISRCMSSQRESPRKIAGKRRSKSTHYNENLKNIGENRHENKKENENESFLNLNNKENICDDNNKNNNSDNLNNLDGNNKNEE